MSEDCPPDELEVTSDDWEVLVVELLPDEGLLMSMTPRA
jgi:hypothetical protein